MFMSSSSLNVMRHPCRRLVETQYVASLQLVQDIYPEREIELGHLSQINRIASINMLAIVLNESRAIIFKM